MIRLDARTGELSIVAEGFDGRAPAVAPSTIQAGMGRELFAGFRQLAGPAEEGALAIPDLVAASPTDAGLIPA